MPHNEPLTAPAATVYGTDEFAEWYAKLEKRHRERVAACVDLLEKMGITLGFPHSSAIEGSDFALRELRVRSHGHAIRVFYAFDPRRSAILPVGGDKTGDDRFYDRLIPIADDLYDVHLRELKQEGLLK